MSSTLAPAPHSFFLSLIELTKPRITLFVLFTCSVGIWLAPVYLSMQCMLATLAGLAAAVGGVNALNMYLERDVDALMARTQNRPLPTGRLQPRVALCLGIILSGIGVIALGIAANLMAATLTLIAVVSYVLLYTPLKQFTPSALYVGAVPGALPPLIGWTAVMGSIDLAGLVLFAIMFLWQIPHFLAIALFRKQDYVQAGLLTLPTVKGDRATKIQIVLSLVSLIPISLVLVPLQMADNFYSFTALVLGLFFLLVGVQGFFTKQTETWAKKLFFVSLIYLTGLFGVLLVSVL